MTFSQNIYFWIMALSNDNIFAELWAIFSKYFSPKHDELPYKQHMLFSHFPCSCTKSRTGLRTNEHLFFLSTNKRTFVSFCSVLRCSFWYGTAWRNFARTVETRLYSYGLPNHTFLYRHYVTVLHVCTNLCEQVNSTFPILLRNTILYFYGVMWLVISHLHFFNSKNLKYGDKSEERCLSSSLLKLWF